MSRAEITWLEAAEQHTIVLETVQTQLLPNAEHLQVRELLVTAIPNQQQLHELAWESQDSPGWQT